MQLKKKKQWRYTRTNGVNKHGLNLFLQKMSSFGRERIMIKR